MIYSSLLFIYIFFPASLLVYYATPKKHRNISLLVLSMIFCAGSGIGFMLFMTVYTVMNYAACLLIGKYRSNKCMSGIILGLALLLDILVLFVFRSDFFSIYREFLSIPESFFPVGISFFTLSAAGTLADVYCGREDAEKNIVSFGLYIMFFPRLIMGPVLRYSSFRKMLDSRHDGLSEIGVGVSLFAKGFAKKVIAADSLYALYIASVSVDVNEMAALTAWLGVTSYFLCLYFTLSGVSDMGAGIGHCFGFRLPQSFNYPVFSSNIRYFAARWHIQAVQWFRRYVTTPLLCLSSNKVFRLFAFIAVWGLFGFWYTFDVNGAVCGAVLGTAIIIETRFRHGRILPLTGVFYTFIISVICSAFMAGDSLSYSFRYLFAMIGGNGIIADPLSVYLLKSYILILLISIYASTRLFRNLLMRSGHGKEQRIITVLSPVIVLSMMILCTVFISYSGSSGMDLLKM